MRQIPAYAAEVNQQVRGLLGAVVLVTLISSSGCATILSKSQYPVEIVNSTAPTHFCVVDKQNQVVEQGMTPTKVLLPAKTKLCMPASYSVIFAGHAATTQRQEIKAGIDPWIVGNLAIGGVPGLAVDAYTGAMYKLPETVRGDVPEQFAVADRMQGEQIVQVSLTAPTTAFPATTGAPATVASQPQGTPSSFQR